MSAERSPVTHPANYSTANFWKHIDNDKKKEYLHVDTLFNRRFLESSRALMYGAASGLAFSLLLVRIKNRFLLAGLASGLSCAVFCNMKSAPVHSQYFKLWDHMKNDAEALKTIRSPTEGMTNDEFLYFYHRYLKFFYPQLKDGSGASECDQGPK